MLFIVSFQIIFALIFLNLFVAVILEGFDESSRLENANLSEFYLSEFKKQWLKFDKKAVGVIECKDLIKFLKLIKLPWDDNKVLLKKDLIINKRFKKHKLMNLVMKMHLPIIQFIKNEDDPDLPQN